MFLKKITTFRFFKLFLALILVGGFLYGNYFLDSLMRDEDFVKLQEFLTFAEDPSTEYVSFQNWPPEIGRVYSSDECREIGFLSGPFSETREESINGIPFCIAEVREGAAGSVYTTYSYYSLKATDPLVVMFTVRMPQCALYSPLEEEKCRKEQGAFNPDFLIEESMK